MDFLLGGLGGCGAGFCTNPLEVVKTRMQLQGELKARGKYTVHYKNSFHAFYIIGKYDGILALQKGLVPALWYQFFMNGCRLGAYQSFINFGWTKDSQGNHSLPRSIIAGAVAGSIGAVVGSPFYMVKTHLQSMSQQEIAVGYQHSHGSMSSALKGIFAEHGVKGLWRGVDGAISRVMVGSAAQLSTFSTVKEYVTKAKLFKEESVLSSFLNALTASIAGGVVVVLVMTPFDVVSTRLYNQGTNTHGRGLFYNGVLDCFVKIFRKEGFWGFYKGWGPSLFRLGPHTVLSLTLWDTLKEIHKGFLRV